MLELLLTATLLGVFFYCTVAIQHRLIETIAAKKIQAAAHFWLPLPLFIFGTLWQYHHPIPTRLLFILIVTLLLFFIGGWLFVGKTYLIAFILPLFFVSGSFLMQKQCNNLQILREKFCNKHINIIAMINDIKHMESYRFRQQLRLIVQYSTTTEEQEYVQQNFVIAYYCSKPTNVDIGDIIELKNIKIQKPSMVKTLSNNPTFTDFLTKERIVGTVFSNSFNYTLINRPTWSIRRWLAHKRQKQFDSISKKLRPQTQKLYRTIFLGNRSEKLEETKKLFTFWGILHFLARSGLHVAIFILFWKIILNLLPAPYFVRQLFLLLLCVTYGLLSWPSIPFWRAFLIFLLYESGKLFGRPPLLLHLLMLTCFCMLLFNPLSVLFLDFQLSFGLTFALVIIPTSITKYRKAN